MESRFLPLRRLRRGRAMAFDRRLHWDSAILPVVPDRALIVDPVRQRTDWAWRPHFCFLPFRERAKVDSPAAAVVVVVAAGFDLCRHCPAIEIVAGLGSVRRRRRFVADSCLFYFAVAVVALVSVSDAVSTARSSF